MGTCSNGGNRQFHWTDTINYWRMRADGCLQRSKSTCCKPVGWAEAPGALCTKANLLRARMFNAVLWGNAFLEIQKNKLILTCLNAQNWLLLFELFNAATPFCYTNRSGCKHKQLLFVYRLGSTSLAFCSFIMNSFRCHTTSTRNYSTPKSSWPPPKTTSTMQIIDHPFAPLTSTISKPSTNNSKMMP